MKVWAWTILTKLMILKHNWVCWWLGRIPCQVLHQSTSTYPTNKNIYNFWNWSRKTSLNGSVIYSMLQCFYYSSICCILLTITLELPYQPISLYLAPLCCKVQFYSSTPPTQQLPNITLVFRWHYFYLNQSSWNPSVQSQFTLLVFVPKLWRYVPILSLKFIKL